MHIESDADKFNAWELCGGDDLLVDVILGLFQEPGCQEQTHRDIARLFGRKGEVPIIM
jgi:hypothetical protein